MKYFRKRLLGHEFIFHFWSKINKLGIPIRVLCALLKKNWLQEERLFRIQSEKYTLADVITAINFHLIILF